MVCAADQYDTCLPADVTSLTCRSEFIHEMLKTDTYVSPDISSRMNSLLQGISLRQSANACSFWRSAFATGRGSALFRSLLNVPSTSPLKKFLP
jgi:hypothetical protein